MQNINIFFSCLVLLLSAGNLGAEICPSTDDESVLQPEYDYLYRFESEAFAEAVGTTNDKSKISIKCDVTISHATGCLYNLRLENCALNAAGGTPNSETAWIDEQPFPDLSKYSLLFSLVGGEVTEVYTHEDDPIYLVNIKRGVLSAFVFKVSYTKENYVEMHTDIHGICPLTSTPQGSSGSVKTTKDMLNCAFPSRTDWQFSPWSMFWNMSFIQNVINSTTNCDYNINIDYKRINKVFCKERHAIMLESSHRTAMAVQTNILYTVSYVRSGPQTEKPAYSSLTRKTDIRYEYERTPDPVTSPDNFLPIATKMLSDLVRDSEDEIRLFTIHQFTDLVAWIRSSHNLRPFVEAVKSCAYLSDGRPCTPDIKELGMSYLKDALMQCNSLPCIEAISHLARTNDISPVYLTFIFTSWSNMHFSKPVILKHIMNMCIDTDSNLCWLSLGALIRRTYTTRQDLEREELEKLQEVARHFPNSIRRLCLSGNSDSEMYQKLLRDLKAIGSMGEIYLLLIPEGDHQLTECLLRSDVPIHVRISALEAIKNVNPCRDDDSCDNIYKKLLPFLLNGTVPTTLRALAFEYLVHVPQKYGYEAEVFGVLKNDENFQLKSYIANSLKSLFKDAHFKKKSSKFIRAMNSLLIDNELSLESIIHHPESKSSSEIEGFFMDLPFMPEKFKGFGFKTAFSKVYESSDVFPRYIHSDSFMKLFNQFLHVFEARGYSEGLEDIFIMFNNVIKDDFNPNSFSLEKILKAIQEVLNDFGQENSKPQMEYNFDENIIKNIRKLEETYRKYKPKGNSFFNIFLDLFGTTITYISSGDVSTISSKLSDMRTLMNDLRKGLSYNTTKVIRVIEAYHQVPTLMGLPLNWTTNATLAFSIRSRLKVDPNEDTYKLYSEGFFQPSAALTFVNRMVLDFPTVTQIGVQANSSAFTSTHWKANLEYSKEKKIFRIEKPSKTEKILDLFRTNQLIKHNEYIDIDDWDIERKSSEWCTDDETSSSLGLQFCLSKSYPLVTKRMKPWALMAGWCKWQFQINPFDEKLESYDVEIVKLPGIKSKELIMAFSTSGSENRREITFNGDNNKERGEIKFDMKITEKPDFLISFKKTKITENSKDIGQRNIIIFSLSESHKYEVIYHEKVKHEELEESHASLNESPQDQTVTTLVQERLISLTTPSNMYRIHEEVNENGDNEKRTVLFSYENWNPEQKWLHMILPPTLWENNSKAWIQFQINWKAKSVHVNSITRETVCSIKDPKYIIELNAKSFEMSGREQINVNLTKREKSSATMLSFANFTYDLWSSESNHFNEKEIKLFNLTISRKSWGVEIKKIRDESKLLYEIELTRAAMSPKNGENTNYVGWWNMEVSETFRLKEHKIKLVFDTDTKMISNQELVDKYLSLSTDDTEDLHHQFIKAKMAVHYPFIDKIETVTFDGYFILSRGATTFRFQKNFVMESSYNNLQLTSYSLYRAEDYFTNLYHQSFFTHVPSQTKAFNTIEYKRTYEPGKCMEAVLKHDIKSFFFDISSNVSYKCNSKGENLHTLLLDLRSNSSYWDMLNTNIAQIIEDKSLDYRYESCNFSHPLLVINVTADWENKIKDHKKKILFTCTSENCQSTELNIHYFQNGKLTIIHKMPNDEGRRLSYERRLSSDAKNLNIKIKYTNATDETDEIKDIQISGHILNKHLHIWKAKINLDTYSEIKSLISKGFEVISNKITAIAQDPHHPVNKLLEPTLKVPLYDYWQGLKKQRKDLMILSWEGVKETFESLKPFYETPLTILTNLVSTAKTISWKCYDTLKEKSVIVWSIGYFNLPFYFYKCIINLPEGLRNLPQMLLPDDRILQVEFVTGRPLEWASFRHWPSISYGPVKIKSFLRNDQEIQPLHRPSDKFKIAMIFGPRSVYTFDEHLYEAAEYSSDCTFLLAHDLRASQFTVLSDKTYLYILFPEMSIRINSEDEVYVNGSQIPSKLPLAAYNGKVVVRRSSVLEIWSPSLRVICNGKHFICVFELDLWHSGGTFGLLGNADGSPYNELFLPNGKTTARTLEFVMNYEVSGKPECKTLNLRPKSSASKKASEACSIKFNSLCFQNRNIRDSFVDVCRSEYEENPSSCYTAAGYSALCYYKNLPSALNCGGFETLDRGIKHQLEVVFIAHEHQSLTVPEKKTAPHKGIERLLTTLNEKFKTNGYSEVLFSLIGFGGKGVHYQPTVHMKGRNIWMPLQTFLDDGLKSLEFNGDKDVDILNALEFASEVFGLNTYNSKIFVVLAENDKQSKDKEAIDRIQRYLEKNGITLYTLSTYPSIEKGKKVFGVRADGQIFPSPKKNGTAFLYVPKGDLAKLTSATRGSIFLSKFLLLNSPPSFYGEFADEVWSKVRKEPQSCRQCSKKIRWWWQELECTIERCS